MQGHEGSEGAAQPAEGLWVRNRDKACFGSAHKPEQFVIPAQLKEGKMRPLAIEGGEDTRVGKALPP